MATSGQNPQGRMHRRERRQRAKPEMGGQLGASVHRRLIAAVDVAVYRPVDEPAQSRLRGPLSGLNPRPDRFITQFFRAGNRTERGNQSAEFFVTGREGNPVKPVWWHALGPPTGPVGTVPLQRFTRRAAQIPPTRTRRGL